MNFIETLLGFSPDAGTGLTELTLIAAMCAAVSIAYFVRSRTAGK